MSPPENETSKIFQIRQSTLDEMRRTTQIGRAIHVWGAIAFAIIGTCIWGGVKFGQLATTTQVQSVEDKLTRIEVRLDDIEKHLAK